MNASLVRTLLRAVAIATVGVSICACGNGGSGLDCGSGYTARYRDVARDTAMVVAGKTVFVQVDRWVTGEFMSFDSSATALADIERKETAGLGDTLRFHATFHEMYYGSPNETIPAGRYLRVATNSGSAISPVIGAVRVWNCKEGTGGAARMSPIDGGGAKGCSIMGASHQVTRMVVEYERGRNVVVGF